MMTRVQEMISAQPLSTCTAEAIEADRGHALVFGRIKVWYKASEAGAMNYHWSKYVWWKAMWYPHRGLPSRSHTWGVYAGLDAPHTGPGDAELTHWLPMPPDPLDT